MVKSLDLPVERQLYVEGGGDKNPSLASECRRAFSKLFERAGVARRPRVIACGGRKAAYDQFLTAHAEAKAEVWLLVDAEALPEGKEFEPWKHVKARPGDGWDRPFGASDEQLQLMTVTMETWLLADRAALAKVFGPRLDMAKLPTEGQALEMQSKSAVNAALKAATEQTSAGRYDKGPHSFKVLAKVDPAKLRALPWARRFLDTFVD